MGGGRGILTCTSTPAIVGMGSAITDIKRIVPKSNLFIFPSILVKKWPLTARSGDNRYILLTHYWISYSAALEDILQRFVSFTAFSSLNLSPESQSFNAVFLNLQRLPTLKAGMSPCFAKRETVRA